MRVLIDRHHHALLESYLMLMEDRFGWEVFSPVGMEWFDEEVWNFEREWHGNAVAKQYLEGVWADATGTDVKLCPDTRHPWRVLKGVTLRAAQDMHWDLVISSLPHNDEGYHRFSRERGAVFGVQVGNHVQQSRWDLAQFILSSSTLPGFGPEYIGQRFTFSGVPTVMYHQEFDTEVFRHEWPPAESRSVASFVNCFAETEPYAQFAALARRHPDFDWKCYGAYGSATEDELAAGNISAVPDVAQAMRDSRIIWHAKAWSDGFGHVIHNAFAVGRPVVGYRRYYQDKMAAPLMVEGETFFDMERPEAEVIDILTRLRDDDDFHHLISTNAAARFRDVVDFDGEAETIKAMLGDVL